MAMRGFARTWVVLLPLLVVVLLCLIQRQTPRLTLSQTPRQKHTETRVEQGQAVLQHEHEPGQMLQHPHASGWRLSHPERRMPVRP